MKISLHTFGCKLNQAETDELKKDLVKLGFSIVPVEHGEAAAVVRACAVTCGASQSVREMIRRLKRNGATVVVVGCLEDKNLPEIDCVGKNNEEVIQFLQKLRGDERAGQVGRPKEQMSRTRAFIKIQTGCNFNCAYCIIPAFRGKTQSVSMEKIIEKIEEGTKDGYKEVVLTGVNICQYHDNTKKINLTGLLKKILEQTRIARLRLGSLDPRLITSELIALYCDRDVSARLLPHWHLSLQSGSDAVLKKMNRLYTTNQYKKIVKKLRASNPLFSFTTDIIVGFPGEADQDFFASCDLVKKIEFAKVHIFPFSSRPKTTAEKMVGQVQDRIKTERAQKLKIVTEEVVKKFADRFVGRKVSVLWENKKGAYWYGYTPEYLRVRYRSKKNLRNEITKIIYRHP